MSDIVIQDRTPNLAIVGADAGDLAVAEIRAGYSVTLISSEIGVPGAPGPTGAAGAPGGSLTKTASETLGGQRVVRADGADGAMYADPTDATEGGTVLGITSGAALISTPVTVVRGGEITEAGWTWAPGDLIFAGAAGVLTQTITPGWAWLRVVGVAVSATRMLVEIRSPMVLG